MPLRCGEHKPIEKLAKELTAVSVDELSDESEVERRDFADAERDPFESEHGPEMGDDGDDNPEYAQPKPPALTTSGKSITVKLGNGKTSKVEVIQPGQVHETIVIQPRTHPAGEIVDAGHGFIVNDPRSRSWKTAPRTHCAYCGGELPTPKVDHRKYDCEFAPALHPGCRCSGCILRSLVMDGHERNVGNPRMCCSAECTRQRDNERSRWKRAVARAEKRGEEPPPEPEDRGLKFVLARGLQSSSEGVGRRYSAAIGVPWNAPRA